MQVGTRHLNNSYLQMGPKDTHTHTQIPQKKMDLNGLYSALQPRRIVWLGVRTAGYMAVSARLDVHPFPELQSPKDGPGQPNPEEARRGDLPCLVGRSLIVMHRTRCLGCVDEAASASRQGQAIWQNKSPTPTNSDQSDHPGQLFTPSPEGRSHLPWTRSRSLDDFGAQMRSSPP